jgi:hypothetical protein
MAFLGGGNGLGLIWRGVDLSTDGHCDTVGDYRLWEILYMFNGCSFTWPRDLIKILQTIHANHLICPNSESI